MIKTPLPSPRIAPALMLLAVLFLGPAAFAEEEGVYKVPPVAFGVGGLYGIYDFAVEGGDKNDGPGNVESSWSAGGGFVLELMQGRYFGLQTGLWFQHSEYVYEDDFKAFGENLLLPFYLLTSVNYGRLTLGVLALKTILAAGAAMVIGSLLKPTAPPQPGTEPASTAGPPAFPSGYGYFLDNLGVGCAFLCVGSSLFCFVGFPF